MIKTNGKFYLAGDAKSKDYLMYDPDDLTTHAVVVVPVCVHMPSDARSWSFLPADASCHGGGPRMYRQIARTQV